MTCKYCNFTVNDDGSTDHDFDAPGIKPLCDDCGWDWDRLGDIETRHVSPAAESSARLDVIAHFRARARPAPATSENTGAKGAGEKEGA